MKTILAFVAVWVMLPVLAQKNIEKIISSQGKESVKMNIQIADSIIISTWNRQEVEIKASVNLNDNKDNDAYITEFDERGSQIVIDAQIKKEYFNDNNCCCRGMIVWTIKVPEKMPVSVETINGNIVITGNTTDIAAKSISGFIDWEVLPGRKADLKLNTVTGTMYSDLGFNFSNNHQYSQSLAQSINGGGYTVKLETISGDIFCRKSKN
jgi:hypothetical protein